MQISMIWDVSKNRVFYSPNHPILIGFSIINHPFWGTPIFGNTHIKETISDSVKLSLRQAKPAKLGKLETLPVLSQGKVQNTQGSNNQNFHVML